MIPAIVAGLLLSLTGRPTPPKYFEDLPLAECMAWESSPTVCCGWRSDAQGRGLVACHQGDDREWFVVARSSD